jgi:thioesterase domain-containing protein
VRAQTPQTPASAQEIALREGMTPAEGIDALDRILSMPLGPQVVASTVDLDVWLEELAAEEGARAPKGEGAHPHEGGPQFDRPSVSATFLAPRDAFERELASVWRELLGVSDVGIEDDFFELGGQSLIAVRLFHRIRRKWGVDLPISTLFQAPSIKECAEVLRDALGASFTPEAASNEGVDENVQNARIESPKEGASEPPAQVEPASRVQASPRKFQALVPVQRGSERNAPLFCVHGAGGNVLNFRDLSRAMAKDQPFYGLQAHGIDGVTRPLESVEAMAESYLREVRALQPRGPYLLGGYSGGGVVAYEMVQQLAAAGEETKLLVFIDTFHPQMPLRRVTTRARIERLRDEGLEYLRHAIRGRIERAHAARDLVQIEELLRKNEPIPFALRNMHLVSRFEAAASRYRPKALACATTRVILYRAESIEYIFRDGGPVYGWDALIASGVEIVRVAGNHDTLLLGANADIVMRSLNAALERARATPEPAAARPEPPEGAATRAAVSP